MIVIVLEVLICFIYFRNPQEILSPKQSWCSEASEFDTPQIGMFIEIGLRTENLIGKTNQTFQGLIVACYVYSLYSIVVISFQMISTIGFNEGHSAMNKMLWFIVMICGIIMYLVRLNFIMKSGQILENKVRNAKRSLDQLLFNVKQAKMNEEELNKLTVLRERLDAYQCLPPIRPYSVFSLNNKTFCATLATTVTYMVILVRLRGVGTSLGPLPLQTAINNVTLAN